MDVSATCKRCGGWESELHVLFSCPFAARVWDLAPCLFKPTPQNTENISQLLQNCRRIISLPPTGLGSTPLFPWILWTLWISRNKFLFENRSFTEEESVLKAIQDARSWEMAQQILLPTPLPQCVVPSRPPTDPELPSWWVFSDVAWESSTGNCGLGWHLRTAEDVVVGEASSHHCFMPSALVAEALALKNAIQFAFTSGSRILFCFSDSKQLISLLSSRGSDNALQGLLFDIHDLTKKFVVISFHFVQRRNNAIADSLAKAALFHLSVSLLVDE